MRETFNLPGIPDDAEVDAEAARLSEEELDLDYDDGDSIFIAIPLAVAWMILLPGFIIGVALNAGWVARLIAAVATTAVVATVVLVGPIRRPLGRAIGRLLPSEE